MLSALLFAAAFVVLLTAVVRVGGLVVRRDPGASKTVALTVAFVVLVCTAWTVATWGARAEDRFVQPLVLPSPGEVLEAFAKLHLEMGLVRASVTSLGRVTFGFALGAVVAVPLGVFMGTFPGVSAFFRPLALVGSYVPLVVFLPLTLVWWGTEPFQKTGFLAICCFVSLLPLVIKTVADVPSALLDVTVTKGATQWQLVSRVILPVAAADIWAHLRGGYGVGWGWIILAEIQNADSGLGSLIYVCDKRYKPGVLAVTIVIVLLAFLCDQAWKWGGYALFPHRRTSRR